MSSPLLNTLLVVVACGGGRCVPAQTATIDLPDPALAERPQVVVLSGISTEGGGDGAFQSFSCRRNVPSAPINTSGCNTAPIYRTKIITTLVCGKAAMKLGCSANFFCTDGCPAVEAICTTARNCALAAARWP